MRPLSGKIARHRPSNFVLTSERRWRSAPTTPTDIGDEPMKTDFFRANILKEAFVASLSTVPGI
jgi:hypothetical protein